MTDVAIHQHHGLAIANDQVTFTPDQVAVLAHMGVENAPEPDLRVFMHVCQRSGLDPFARQIHMIGRNSKKWDPRTKSESWETKYTIQTGIDGYRLIGRRAADRAGVSISITQPEWAHEDGTWRPVWSRAWGVPVAARVTIEREGKPFTAVALFDEYKQTKRDGGLTSMWEQRPAGQLAKCCEALAWRMAFPQDLSGIYTDDEMGQADRPEAVTAQPSAPPTAAAFRQSAPAADDDVHDADVVEESEPVAEGKLTEARQRRLFQMFKAKGIGEHQQRNFLEWKLDRQVSSRTAMTDAEYAAVTDHLETMADRAVPTPTTKDKAWGALTTEAGKHGITDKDLLTKVVEQIGQPYEELTAEQLQEALAKLLARVNAEAGEPS